MNDKHDMNDMTITGSDEPDRALEDYGCLSVDGHTRVIFRDLERELRACIDMADAVAGCVAWLTYREILALEPTSGGKSTPRHSRMRWTGRHRRILIGGLVTVAAASLLGYTYASRPRPPEVEVLPLQVAWPYWQELRQGLDRYPSPGERKFVEDMNRSRFGEGVWLSVTAAGLLFTAVSFIMRPRGSRGRLGKQPYPREGRQHGPPASHAH